MYLMKNVHYGKKFPKHLIFKIIEECSSNSQVVVSIYHHSKCLMNRVFYSEELFKVKSEEFAAAPWSAGDSPAKSECCRHHFLTEISIIIIILLQAAHTSSFIIQN